MPTRRTGRGRARRAGRSLAARRPRRRAARRPARAGADPPVVRVRERRAADQRAPGVPGRLGARPGRHRRALPQPAGPPRGPAGQAACLGRQHDLAGRRRPAARRRRHRPAPAARPRRGDHRRPGEGLDPRRRARGADRRGPPRLRAGHRRRRSCTGCSTRCWSRPPPAAPAWTGRPASRSSAPPAGSVRPATRSRTTVPTTPRPSPPPSSSPAPCYGRGARPDQEGRRAGGRRGRLARPLRRRLSPPMPELPEVEVVRRGLEQWVAGRTVAAVEVHHPRAVRRHLEGAEHFVAALTGRTFTDAHRRGKYLWLPLAEPDGAPSGRPWSPTSGMSGQLLVEKPSPARRDAPARPVHLHRRRPRAALRRPAHLRRPGGRGAGRRTAIPGRLAHIAIDPLDETFDVDAFSRRAAPAAHRGQAGAARPDADRRRRQHLRRRGAVAGPAARRPAHRQAHPRPGRRPARRRPRRAGGGAGPGRHVVRLPVRRRQRAERLLLALPRRLRPGRPALPALRDADPPGVVHEPVELQLPAVPAAPATRRPRHDAARRRPRLRPRAGRRATGGSSGGWPPRPGWPARRRNLPDGRVEVVLEGPDDAVAPACSPRWTVRGAPGHGDGGSTSRDEPVQGSTGFTTA